MGLSQEPTLRGVGSMSPALKTKLKGLIRDKQSSFFALYVSAHVAT